jgi:hypothetical protein
MSEQVCIDESGGGCLFCSWQPGKREKNKEKPGFQYPLQRHVPSGYNTYIHGNGTRKHPVSLSFFYKIGEQENRTGAARGGERIREGYGRVNIV